MIPLIFCGRTKRYWFRSELDWPRWMFWRKGHREHEHDTWLIGPTGPFLTRACCPGYEIT